MLIKYPFHNFFTMLSNSKLLRKEYGLLLNGKWIKSQANETFVVINPSNKEKLTSCSRAKKADVDNTVKESQKTFKKWKQVDPSMRGKILYQISKIIRSKKQKLSEILTLDTGKPISQSKGEIETAIRYFEYYAGAADKIHGESIPLKQNYTNYTVRDPFGVSAHIMPWNFPIGMFGREVAPALAAGNVVIVKPAEEGSISVLTLAEMILETDLIPGVVNVITGFGPEAGASLAGHPGIDRLTFTGSVKTGKEVMKLAANNITPISLELGGKNPMIVFPDADIENSVNSIINGAFLNSGQVCSACSRLLLHKKIHHKFLKHLVERTRQLRIGPGLKDPDIGPLISEQQYNKVINYINLGIKEGAILVTGGNKPLADNLPIGYFIEPTIFDNVSSDMKIAQEEIFGPVLSVMQFETAEEALQIANSTSYGLVAGVFTNNLNIAHKFAKEIKTGQVYINEWFAGGVETPFGGFKKSGFGRLKGLEGLLHYTQVKNICIKHK